MTLLSLMKMRILVLSRPLVRYLRPVPPSHLKPVSRRWGFERGTAIGRVLIDQYMEKQRADITGVVLEIKNRRYTESLGSHVTQSDVLDIDTSNLQANIHTDLAKADAVPANTYDCFVLTETLQFVFDLNTAIKHAYRILKPNGILLVSVPQIAPQDTELAGVDYWRFTKLGCQRLFGDVFGAENVEVTPYGNFATCISSLSGVAAEELPPEEFEYVDEKYIQGLFVRAQKKS